MYSRSHALALRRCEAGLGPMLSMPFADRLAAHMFLGDMVALGVKILVRHAARIRWTDAPMQSSHSVH